MAAIYKREQNGKTDNAYSVTVRTHTGRRARLALFPDKAASQTAADCVERLIDLRRAGREPGAALLSFIDNCGPRLRARLAELDIIGAETRAAAEPLPNLIAQWDATRRSRNAMAKKESKGRVDKICRACGFHSLQEIAPAPVDHYLEGMNKSARTYNLYLSNLKTFLNWCVKTGLLMANPLRALSPKDERADRRRERRALTDEEIMRLLSATLTGGEKHHGLEAHERALIYWLAIEAGTRLNEIYTLQRKCFHLAEKPPHVTLEGAHTKNGKTESVAITPELAAVLAGYFKAAPALPMAPAFPMNRGRGAEMLRRDLAAAGIPYRDEWGRVMDFHGLRHTCGTRLLRNGVALAVAQRQMRHSTPTLTANTYGHIELIDKAAAVKRLPPLSMTPPAAKDGTADEPGAADAVAAATGETVKAGPESLGNSLGNSFSTRKGILGISGNFDGEGAGQRKARKSKDLRALPVGIPMGNRTPVTRMRI